MDREFTPAQKGAMGLLLLWSLGWKAASTWQAARDGSKPWFVALFCVNSLGILDALYLFRFSEARRRARAERHEVIVDEHGYVQQIHREET